MNSIVLFLLGQKGYQSLRSLLEGNVQNKMMIKMVILGKDAGVTDDYSQQIQVLCTKHSIPFSTEYRNPEMVYKTGANYGIAVGWRWLIDISKIRLIVLHDSLLPKYRGFNPLVTALIEGDNEIGVTALFANDEIDSGDIIDSEKCTIDYPLKISKAVELVSRLYEVLILRVVQKIKEGAILGTKQSEKNSSFSLWRNEEDYFVNWNESAEKIKRFIDSVGEPYLGACTNYRGKLIRLIDASVVPDLNIVNRSAGKILIIKNNCPVIVCGLGLIQINEAFDNTSKDKVIFDRVREKLK